MRGSLVLSVIGHALLLGWVLFTIQTQAPLRVAEPEPLAVDLVTPGDITKLRQGDRTAKQLEGQLKDAPKSEPSKKEAEKPRQVPQRQPAEQQPAETPETKPETKPEAKPDQSEPKIAALPKQQEPTGPTLPSVEEQRKLDELVQQQEAQRKQEEARQQEQKKREEAKKKKQEDERKRKLAEKKKEEEKRRKEAEAKKKQESEFSKIAALLDKRPDKGSAQPKSDTEPSQKRGPALGAQEGHDKQLSASELAIIGQIIKTCVQSKWSVMGGGEGTQHTQVKVRLRFNPDGRLNGAPTIMNPQSTPVFLAVSDSALRAVQACEPFPLPADKYDVWKDLVLNFDPREMF